MSGQCFPLRPTGLIVLTRVAIAAFTLVASQAWCDEPPGKIELVSDDAGQPAAFEAHGLSKADLARFKTLPEDDARWGQAFSVYVVDPEAGKVPPIVGTYTVESDSLRFTPRFKIRPGLTYRAVLRPQAIGGGAAAKALTREFVIAKPARGAPTTVTAIYPTATTLPENQLKFYLHFSAPMSRGEAYQHIQLLGDDGKPADLPFLEIGEELWDPSGRRLTLLVDPGRIKRGVKPREELGPVFEAGRNYTLIISKKWRDANGQPLAESFKKQFQAGPPIEKAIATADWKISVPAGGTRQPLRVQFPYPMDHALLQRTLSVTGKNDQTISGEFAVADFERRWEFIPSESWQPGNYNLVVDTAIEDLAANRIGQPFEVDRLEPIKRTVEAEFEKIPFTIKAGSKLDP